jgi:phospholipase/carboxylesterase
MTADALVLNHPEPPSGQLMLLLPADGGGATSMVWLGARLAAVYPQAWIVALHDPATLDRDAQGLAGTVRQWQAHSGVSEEGTALIGFAQGADAALRAVAASATMLAGRTVAIAAGYGGLAADAPPPPTTLHLIHGKHDAAAPWQACVAAAEHLVAIGADLTADVVPFLGHDLNAEVVELLLTRLQTYLPRRRWEEALRDAPLDAGSVQ